MKHSVPRGYIVNKYYDIYIKRSIVIFLWDQEIVSESI